MPGCSAPLQLGVGDWLTYTNPRIAAYVDAGGCPRAARLAPPTADNLKLEQDSCLPGVGGARLEHVQSTPGLPETARVVVASCDLLKASRSCR